MDEAVPTRAERLAAVLAAVALVAAMAAAAFGYGVAAIVSLFVAFVGGTIAKARVDAASLRLFGLRRVEEDDTAVERYRERRRRERRAVRETIDALEYDPRWDRVLAVGLALVGVGALALVASAGDRLDPRWAGRLLVVALIALNCALIALAASSIDSSADEE